MYIALTSAPKVAEMLAENNVQNKTFRLEIMTVGGFPSFHRLCDLRLKVIGNVIIQQATCDFSVSV